VVFFFHSSRRKQDSVLLPRQRRATPLPSFQDAIGKRRILRRIYSFVLNLAPFGSALVFDSAAKLQWKELWEMLFV
jgi:hypothetical protein